MFAHLDAAIVASEYDVDKQSGVVIHGDGSLLILVREEFAWDFASLQGIGDVV